MVGDCGKVGHEQDCLCDVQHLGVEITDDGVNGMWQGDRIADILKTDFTDPEDLLTWLTTVTDVHDKWVENQDNYGVSFDDIRPMELMDGPLLSQWAQIRRGVKYCVTTFPVQSVVDVLEKLCIDANLFMTAFTTNKFPQKMTYDRLRSLEVDMLAEKPNYAEVGRKHGIPRQVIINFRSLLAPIKKRQHGHVGFQRV